MTATQHVKNPVGKDAMRVWGCEVVQVFKRQHEGSRDGGIAKKLRSLVRHSGEETGMSAR